MLSGNCVRSSLKRGETIFKTGISSVYVVYLRSGLVKESISGVNDREQIIQIVKPLYYIGVSAMLGSKVSQMRYEVIKDAEVCYIDSGVFKQLVQQNGLFAYEILAAMCRENLGNYHRFVEKSQKQLYGRLADSLLYFADIIFNSSTFELPVNQNDLAAFISTTRESVSRGLSKLSTEGIISFDGRNLRIIDRERLDDISRNG